MSELNLKAVTKEEYRKLPLKNRIIRTEIVVIRLFITIFFIILMIKSAFTTIKVDGTSMTPTYKNGEYVLAIRSQKFENPYERGNVISFYCKPVGKRYIKRVIALPEDHLQVKGEVVFVNGKRLDEPYTRKLSDLSGDEYEYYKKYFETIDIDIIVPKGQVFVMGDNRCGSKDSRYFGPVEMTKKGTHKVVYKTKKNSLIYQIIKIFP